MSIKKWFLGEKLENVLKINFYFFPKNRKSSGTKAGLKSSLIIPHRDNEPCLFFYAGLDQRTSRYLVVEQPP